MARAAKRGSLVHRLLEVLPDLPEDRRAAAARKYLEIFGEDFDDAERAELAEETLKLMALPELMPLFGPGSRAEAAISGLVDLGGRAERIEGRVDRLAVRKGGVWVLDYKTNRPAAKTLDDVAPAYWKQMAGYRALLRQLYPRITVHCALVWTHAPSLMVLPQYLLEAKWAEISGKTDA
jgi:ATP-dependent helicase/nuclease subunit A